MATANLLDADHPDPRVNHARNLHVKGDLAGAEKLYLDALQQGYDDPLLLFYAGTLFMQQGRYGLAIVVFSRGVTIAGTIPELYNNLGTSLKALGDYQHAEMAFRKAVALREEPDFLNNMVTVYINNGTPAEAEKWCRRVLAKRPDHPQALWNLSLALLEQGRYGEGFDLYDWGLRNGGRPDKQYNCPPWDGQEVETLAVYGEQGIGDEIMFMGMVPDVLRSGKVGRIILDAHPRLAPMFQRSFEKEFPGRVKVYPTRKVMTGIPWLYDEGKIDAKIAAGSLGKYFRRRKEDFPRHEGYLVADPALIELYRGQLAEAPRRKGPLNIGLSWEGGTAKTNADFRRIPPEQLAPLMREIMEVGTVVNLQYTKDALDQLRPVVDRFGVAVWHSQKAIEDYEHTAGLLANLDLIISVCTSVVHLGGAMNRPVWCLTPARPAWRYGLEGEAMDWYPSVCQFRQRNHGDWTDVLANVRAALAHYRRERGL